MSRLKQPEHGFVLVLVLFFCLLLVSGITTFIRRATIDATVVQNRDAIARAEALARGGLRLATALVLEDRLQEKESPFAIESLFDVWAGMDGVEIDGGDGATLTLSIRDSGARLNLNALFDDGKPLGPTEVFLTRFLKKVIDEMPGRPEEKLYEAAVLARHLIDWVDADELILGRGGSEASSYQRLSPPYRPPNRALLSVDELRLIEGFDGKLVEAMAPYLTVFPLAGGIGINPNTASTWVLALVYHGVGGDRDLANAKDVEALAKARQDGLLCAETTEDCLGVRDAAGIQPGTIYPAPFPGNAQTYVSDVFHVRAEARVGEIRRRLDAVIDRSDPTQPRRLAWRME